LGLMNPRSFLSPEEIDRINKSVTEAEGKTAGEIVPMVVRASDDYPHLFFIGGVLGLFLAAALVIVLEESPLPGTWVPALLGGFVGGYLLFLGFPGVRRMALGRDVAVREVMERALRAFHEHALSRTRRRTGILILISLFERQVQVLADEGINAQVPQETWNELVQIILAGIREGKPGDAICRAIERCGDILAERFPIEPDDVNELPNQLIIEP
jgi:putative membrane protein